MSEPARKGAAIFKTVSDSVVKSITQRQILRYWERIRGADVLPTWSRFDRAEFSSCRENLCVMEVRREGDRIRLYIREHGEKLAEYYGSACAGRYLDDFMSPEALAALSAIYAQVMETRRPVYTVAPVTDSRGRSVTCERLLLPFTLTGNVVDVVLVSLEAICIDGAFDQLKVFEPTQHKFTAGFQGVIEAPAQG
ncbi:MAG TPA: PAS domain-containing protein [Xanthobacteraceae bacterium]|nr:PAS domain-containing protein [Xanthobacteraceae bacterium]